jgi:hypothetical protein
VIGTERYSKAINDSRKPNRLNTLEDKSAEIKPSVDDNSDDDESDEKDIESERAVDRGVCQRSCPPISCGVSDFRGADFVLGVKPDGSGGLPVAGFACPAFRVLHTCICIEHGAVCERRAIMATVACVRRDEADGAVQVLAVIPAGEGFYPDLRIGPRGKPLGRPVWSVFAGAEQRF